MSRPSLKNIYGVFKRIFGKTSYTLTPYCNYSKPSAKSGLTKSVQWSQSHHPTKGPLNSKPPKMNNEEFFSQPKKVCLDVEELECGLHPMETQKGKKRLTTDCLQKKPIEKFRGYPITKCSQGRHDGCAPTVPSKPTCPKFKHKDCKNLGRRRYKTHVDCQHRKEDECLLTCPGQSCKVYPANTEIQPKKKDPCD